MFKNMKIMNRLGIGFGIILSLMICLGSIALFQMSQLSELTRKLYTHSFQVSNMVQRVGVNIVRLQDAMKDVTLARIPQEVNVAVQAMEFLEKEIETDFNDIERLHLGDPAMVEKALSSYRSWLPIRDEIIDLVNRGETWRAAEVSKGRGAAHMAYIAQSIALLNESAEYEAESFFHHTRKVQRQSFAMMYWALGITLTIGLFFTWFFPRSVASPIQEIVEVSNAIAGGDLNRRITYHSHDEMGQMAESLRRMLSGVIGEGQSIKQGIPIVFWTADTDLTMTYINHAAALLTEALTDLPARELIGKYRVHDALKDEDGLCATMARKSLHYGMQGDKDLFFRDQGDLICLRCVTSQLKDLSGQVVGVMGVGIDITQRIETEEKLMQSEGRLEEAQRIAHLGHWEFNMGTRQATWSRELFRILGLEPVDGPIGKELLEKMVPEELYTLIRRVMAEVRYKGRTVFEERITLPDGHTRWVVGKGLLARDEKGEPLSAFGTVQDITEQKLAEEERRALENELRQSQKLQAIGTLAGGIAHDFNNILAAILGFSELLMEELPRESPQRPYVDEVLKAAQRARDLVKQILNFSRQADQTLIPVFLRPVVKEAVKLLRATIPSSITIDLTLGEGDEHPVLADPTHIHQMVMNLGTNAAHAMKQKGHLIAISLEQLSLPETVQSRHPDLAMGEYQCFTITDQGCGLTPETLPRIFDPFFTTKEPGEGTGMGLSVVHGIVKGLKGAVEVKSQVDAGTCVSIWLPTMEAEHPPVITPSKTELPGGLEHILLVDDERSIITFNMKTLEHLGYHITACHSGDEALRVFRKTPDAFQLIITDMNMPNLNGAQLAERVLAIRPDVPIILLTGYSEQLDETQAQEIGIRQYLYKPLNRRQLAHAVRSAIDDTKAELPETRLGKLPDRP